MTYREFAADESHGEQAGRRPDGITRPQFDSAGSRLMSLVSRWATAVGPRRIIDVHHHFLPPQYLQEAPASANVQRAVAWTPAKTLKAMDQNGVQVAMLGVTPGISFASLLIIQQAANFVGRLWHQMWQSSETWQAS
jgi:hypothetical protein